MKALAILLGGVLLGIGAYYVGSRLSSDAIALVLGLLFGILAGVPPLLLAALSGRRPGAEEARLEAARLLLAEERRRLLQAQEAARAWHVQELEQHGHERRRLTVYHEEE